MVLWPTVGQEDVVFSEVLLLLMLLHVTRSERVGIEVVCAEHVLIAVAVD